MERIFKGARFHSIQLVAWFSSGVYRSLKSNRAIINIADVSTSHLCSREWKIVPSWSEPGRGKVNSVRAPFSVLRTNQRRRGREGPWRYSRNMRSRPFPLTRASIKARDYSAVEKSRREIVSHVTRLRRRRSKDIPSALRSVLPLHASAKLSP